jgi:23S rRNA A2030 N6-methylase RlmJ
MNYRHAYHAGNFADCFKHALLIALLDSFARSLRRILSWTRTPGRAGTILIMVKRAEPERRISGYVVCCKGTHRCWGDT